MKRLKRRIAAVAVGLCVAAPAAPATAQPVITAPDWMQLPSGEDLARAYPAVAQSLGLEGRATISCTVSDVGMLEGCNTMSEEPAELGFGRGALSMSQLFRMKPMTRDGRPVPGGTVRIPIRFVLPRSEPREAPSGAPPRKLHVARELVKRYGIKRLLTDPLEREVQQIAARSPGVSQATVNAAAAALRQAGEANESVAEDAAAEVYAAIYGEAEMAEMNAFLASPGGSVFLPDGEMSAFQRGYTRRLFRRATTAAWERLRYTPVRPGLKPSPTHWRGSGGNHPGASLGGDAF